MDEKIISRSRADVHGTATFYEFLVGYRPEITRICQLGGDAITDLACDLRVDPDAPRGDVALHRYFERKPIPEEVVSEAWLAYLAARA
jgi:hypothetical protein